MKNICEAWERYKFTIRRYPNHIFYKLTQIHILRNGLQKYPKLLLDAIIGGSLMSKSANNATTVFEGLELGDHQGQHNKKNFPEEEWYYINKQQWWYSCFKQVVNSDIRWVDQTLVKVTMTTERYARSTSTKSGCIL